MKRFIIKISIFLAVLVPVFSLIVYLFLERYGKYVDPYYARLTSKHPNGLIVGSSRSAQILEPDLIHHSLYNFSFTLAHSPFDSSYLRLIKLYHDIQPHDSDRLHIISVDPLSVMTTPNNPYEIKNPNFSETLYPPITNPNIQYLFRYLDLTLWWKLALLSNESIGYVNEKGRYVVPLDSSALASGFKNVLENKVRELKEGSFKTSYISPKRLNVLTAVIEYLVQDGKVVLVRLPVHPEILAAEKFLAPDFDSVIGTIAQNNNISYIKMINDGHRYTYTDGHHIWNGHSRKVSTALKDSLSFYD